MKDRIQAARLLMEGKDTLRGNIRLEEASFFSQNTKYGLSKVKVRIFYGKKAKVYSPAMFLATWTPLAEAWDREWVMPLPSPMMYRPG